MNITEMFQNDLLILCTPGKHFKDIKIIRSGNYFYIYHKDEKIYETIYISNIIYYFRNEGKELLK